MLSNERMQIASCISEYSERFGSGLENFTLCKTIATFSRVQTVFLSARKLYKVLIRAINYRFLWFSWQIFFFLLSLFLLQLKSVSYSPDPWNIRAQRRTRGDGKIEVEFAGMRTRATALLGRTYSVPMVRKREKKSGVRTEEFPICPFPWRNVIRAQKNVQSATQK